MIMILLEIFSFMFFKIDRVTDGLISGELAKKELGFSCSLCQARIGFLKDFNAWLSTEGLYFGLLNAHRLYNPTYESHLISLISSVAIIDR